MGTFGGQMGASFSAMEFPKRSLLGLILFNIFICGIGRGTDIKTSRSVGDTKIFWEMFYQKNLAKLGGQKTGLRSLKCRQTQMYGST